MTINELLETLLLKQKPKDNQFQLKENQPVEFIITIRWDGDYEHCDCKSTTTYTFYPDSITFTILKSTIEEIVQAVFEIKMKNLENEWLTPDLKNEWFNMLTEEALIPRHCTCISDVRMYLRQDDIQIEVEPDHET